MDASPYVYEPSRYPGHEAAIAKICSSVRVGKIDTKTFAEMFKAAWEQSLLEPRTRLPIVILEATLSFATGILGGLASEAQSNKTFESLVRSGAVTDLDDRLKFYDSFLGLAGDTRQWIGLGEKNGAIEWAENVLIDQSTADAIYTYVCMPLIYGKFPSADSWDSVSMDRNISALGVPDSVGSAELLNRSNVGFDAAKKVLLHGIEMFRREISAYASFGGGDSGAFRIRTTMDELAIAVRETTPPSSPPKEKNWKPWLIVGAVGAGAFAYNHFSKKRDNA